MIAVMPETMSLERRKMLKAFGAEVVLTPAKEDVAGAIARAEEIAKNTPGSFMPNQFKNPDNIKTHSQTTAQEILQQTQGKLDYIVIAAGTGGTLSGVASVLKERIPGLKVCVVEPAGSAVLSGCEAGTHRIQGIGEGFIPENLKCECFDEVIPVSDEEAIQMARKLCKEEAIFGGISAGANVFAALKVAEKLDKKAKILTFIPDSGQRYLTCEVYDF
jgi:cysteine synthase A